MAPCALLASLSLSGRHAGPTQFPLEKHGGPGKANSPPTSVSCWGKQVQEGQRMPHVPSVFQVFKGGGKAADMRRPAPQRFQLALSTPLMTCLDPLCPTHCLGYDLPLPVPACLPRPTGIPGSPPTLPHTAVHSRGTESDGLENNGDCRRSPDESWGLAM